MKIINFRINKKAFSLIGITFLSGAIYAGYRSNYTHLTTPKNALVDIGNPCQIALTAHSGESQVDRNIVQYQQLSQRGRAAEAYLERLGWAYIAKARSSFDPGYYKLAQQTALCMDQKRSNNANAQLLLGHILHNLHNFKDSEKLARELVEKRGSWLDYGLLGDAQMEQGKLYHAIGAYQQMLDLRPGPQAYFRAAHIRWLKGDLAGAIDLMEMVVNSLGGKDKETAAWSYVKLAAYERQANHILAAEAHISRALEYQPDYASALLLRGEILMSRHANREAVQVLAKAVRINPLPFYQWTYWEALQQVGDINKAGKVNQELLELGTLLDRRSLAVYLSSTRQNSLLALTLARQELELRQDVFTLDALAWALLANGQPEEAYRYSVQALSEGTVDARLLYHAAVIADEFGAREEARRHYQVAMANSHLLFPSERRELASKFAAIMPQTNDLALNHNAPDHTSTVIGELNENAI